MDTRDLYQEVTDKVVAQIEAGAGEWHMPWQVIATSRPVNALTHKPYKGGNHVWFALVADANGWGTHWATYKQWQTLGAQVRKGEHASHGVNWSPKPIIRKDEATGEDKVVGSRMVPHGFSVFNAAQVDGWEAPAPELRDTPERIAHAESFFAALGADVRDGNGRAFYAPVGDYIGLPELAAFTEAASYYATAAHEHAHWTGHKDRLDRNLHNRFGDDAYAAEELVAELSAAFTCAHLGISTTDRPDHAAYLAAWLKVLKADPTALFTAASKAQAATDWLVTHAGDNGVEEAA